LSGMSVLGRTARTATFACQHQACPRDDHLDCVFCPPHHCAFRSPRLPAAHHLENVIRRALRFPPDDSSRLSALASSRQFAFLSRSSQLFRLIRMPPRSFPDPQIVSTCANTASIFPHDSALRSPRLPAVHHPENVMRRALRLPPDDSSRRLRLHDLATLLFVSRSSQLFRLMRMRLDHSHDSALGPPRLRAAHHVKNVSIPSLWSQFLPATLFTAPSALCRATALCASITRRPIFGPLASTTRRPPPRFCILRYDVFSSARPSSFQPPGRRSRYVSILSYILSAQLRKRDHCQRLRKGKGQV
jgi:hypothetical protein